MLFVFTFFDVYNSMDAREHYSDNTYIKHTLFRSERTQHKYFNTYSFCKMSRYELMRWMIIDETVSIIKIFHLAICNVCLIL